MNTSKTSFTLKCTNADFTQRQKNIFDQLRVLENNRKNNAFNEQKEEDPQIGNNRRAQRSATKHFRGKESIFKKPQNPVPKNYLNRIPDFKKNPHKWTRYSLDDVSDEDISEKGNTRAALTFLKELEQRRGNEMDCGESTMEELPAKIVFKRHTSTSNKPLDDEDPELSKPSFKSSKVIMPEYIVGQKAKKEKKNKNIKAGKGNELKLDHLFENEDE